MSGPGALSPGFSYREAFSRNVGFVTDWEQQQLRGKTVAIAGMGGVGGVHLTTLARMGVGGFHIADMDTFELANFNRQAGAMVSTLGAAKVEVLSDMAHDINPELRLETFTNGVQPDNVDDFLRGVDLYVDSLDFFATDARRLVFRRCAELGIPAVTAAPLGMTVAYLIFMPGQMTFEQYFGLEGLSSERQSVNLLVGLSPRGFQRDHLIDPTRVDLANRRGPSTPMACQLCAGVTGVEAVKILLGRGPVHAAPWYHQFDPYRGRWVRGYLPGGYRNPLQVLRRRIGYRWIRASHPALPPAASVSAPTEMEAILDLARWAPSGDNSQPWRFEVHGRERVTVHLRDESDVDLYDFDGEPTLLAAGCLLENLAIAASAQGRSATWSYRRGGAHEHQLAVELPATVAVAADPLLPYVTMRAVDRRRYRVTPLAQASVEALEACLGDELELRWFRSRSERWQMARLNAAATRLRLTIPETFDVHKRIVDFHHAFSPTGVASKSLGMDPLLTRVMGWGLRSYARTQFLNRYLWGTALPRLQMDLTPGMMCGGHFMIAFKQQPTSEQRPLALLRAGQAIQRLWLTATQLGLAMQPGVAPLVFARLAARSAPFTEHRRARQWARSIAERVARCWPGAESGQIIFAARIGVSGRACLASRSVRQDLSELLLPAARSPQVISVPETEPSSHGTAELISPDLVALP